MDQKVLLKHMIEFHKAAFDSTFNVMSILLEQTETMTNSMLENAIWMPIEGKKAVKEWVNSCKKGREDYKNMVNDSFKKVETFFEDH